LLDPNIGTVSPVDLITLAINQRHRIELATRQGAQPQSICADQLLQVFRITILLSFWDGFTPGSIDWDSCFVINIAKFPYVKWEVKYMLAYPYIRKA